MSKVAYSRIFVSPSWKQGKQGMILGKAGITPGLSYCLGIIHDVAQWSGSMCAVVPYCLSCLQPESTSEMDFILIVYMLISCKYGYETVLMFSTLTFLYSFY